jgi:flagella basal body P-ring formation protein FlgA
MIPIAALAVAAACLPIDAPKDQITAADLARSLPEWSMIAPDTAISLAPAPGVVRVLHIAELRRLATRFGVTSEPSAELCYERPIEALSPDRMLSAMQAQLPNARIEILEASRMPAPVGDVEFPLSGLRPGYWSGYVAYGSGRKFAIWARVNVRTTVKCVVASADLKPGQPIEAGQLTIEARDMFPTANLRDAGADAIGAIANRVPRRVVRAGTIVQTEWLDAPKSVQRGDRVKVEVVNGGARLEIEGIAETGGAVGELIFVQNPDSKRRFRARVESQGHVSVKSTL